MDVTFHCDQSGNFQLPQQLVRGFSYKDYTIEPHTHEFYEMNIILKGSGTHCLEDAALAVRPGDVFVIPPMTVHAYRNTENLEVYHILLHQDFVAANLQEATKIKGFVQLMEIEPFLRRRESTMFLHLDGSMLLQLQADLSTLDDSTRLPQALKDHTVWKILYWLSFLLEQQMQIQKPANRHEASVIKALAYIHEHYDEKLTDELLCRQVYLSRSTFLRSFQTICGCSPAAYLRSYRKKKALEFLRQGQLSKTQIAHACGFYDLSHMQRCIKEE